MSISNIHSYLFLFEILVLLFAGFVFLYERKKQNKGTNFKIITVELITFILWVFLLTRTISSETIETAVFNGLLLIISIFFGTFLIKGSIREVEKADEVKKLVAELKVANQQLLELDKKKTEFVSLATHQLRGPLTSIKGYASLILDGDFGKVPSDLQDPLEKIMKSCHNMTLLIDDFLDVTKIESGEIQYNFKKGDLRFVAQKVFEEMRAVAKEKNLKMSLKFDEDENYEAIIDEIKIRQVISNFLDNAIKYTQAGRIEIHMKSPKKGDHILISVKDTGIGVKPEELPLLFEKFRRASNASQSNVVGTGLGLFVAKKIIDAHGGEIGVFSDGIGSGSEFFIKLPKEKNE